MSNRVPDANLAEALLDSQSQRFQQVRVKGLLGTLFLTFTFAASFQYLSGQGEVSSGTLEKDHSQVLGQTTMCNSSYNIWDLALPLRYVVPWHPEGGQCYFGTTVSWFSQCGWAINNRDFSRFGEFARNSGSASKYLRFVPAGRDYPKQATITYWGGTIKTNNDLYTFDDIYCHGNGWTSLPRALVNNYTAWSSLARQKCHQLTHAVPNYRDLSMSYMFDQCGRMGDEANSSVTPKIFAGKYVPTQYDMQQHAAWKCALDADIGVACDMAYCAHNFCDLGGGYIGHGSECE